MANVAEEALLFIRLQANQLLDARNTMRDRIAASMIDTEEKEQIINDFDNRFLSLWNTMNFTTETILKCPLSATDAEAVWDKYRSYTLTQGRDEDLLPVDRSPAELELEIIRRRLAEAEAQNKEATETIKKLEAYNEVTNDALDAFRLDEDAKLSGGIDVAAQTYINEAALHRQEESAAEKLAQCQRRLASEKEKSASLEASLRSQQRELELVHASIGMDHIQHPEFEPPMDRPQKDLETLSLYVKRVNKSTRMVLRRLQTQLENDHGNDKGNDLYLRDFAPRIAELLASFYKFTQFTCVQSGMAEGEVDQFLDKAGLVLPDGEGDESHVDGCDHSIVRQDNYHLRFDINELRNERIQLTRRLDDLEQRDCEWRAMVQTCNSEITKLQAENSTKDQAITVLEADLVKAKLLLVSEQGECAELREKIKTRTGGATSAGNDSSLKQQVDELTARLNQRDNQVASLQSLIAQPEHGREQQNNDELTFCHLKIEELEVKIEDRDDTILSLRARGTVLRSKVASLKKKFELANARNDSWSKEKNEQTCTELVASSGLMRKSPYSLECVKSQDQPVPLIPRLRWSKHRERLRRVGIWTCGDKPSRYMAYQKTAFVMSAVAYTYGVLHIMSPKQLELTPEEIEVVERNMDIMAKDLENTGCVFTAFSNIAALAKAAKEELPKLASKAKQLLKNGKNTWRTPQEKKEMGKTNNLQKDQRDFYTELGFFAPKTGKVDIQN